MNRARAALIAVVVALAAACGGETGSSGDADVAMVETVEGVEVNLDGLDEENVLLWFWSPSCRHCRAAIPDLIEAHDEFGDDVRFLGVVAPHDKGDAAEMMLDEGLDGFDHIVDSGYDFANTFGVMGLPTYVALGSDGGFKHSVGAPASAELGSKLTQLLAA